MIKQLETEIGDYRSKDPFLANKKEGVNQVELDLRQDLDKIRGNAIS